MEKEIIDYNIGGARGELSPMSRDAKFCISTKEKDVFKTGNNVIQEATTVLIKNGNARLSMNSNSLVQCECSLDENGCE